MATELPHSDLNTLHDRLAAEIPNGSSVLDVGAGLAKYHQLLIDKGCKLTLIDAHKPYLDERAARFPQAILVHGEAEFELRRYVYDVGQRGLPRWDVALGIDFLEHTDTTLARKIAFAMREVANRVILFVPEGNHPQDKDHYAMGGDHWQTHRSTWYAADLEQLSFTVERWVDFHAWAVNERGNDPGALWATWRRS